MKKIGLVLMILISLFSCKDKGCEDIACFTPPPNFVLELVDSSTGENLFTNETLNSNDIIIVDEDGKNVTYEFIPRENLNLINLNEIGWNLGFRTYTISVGDDVIFNLELDMEEKHENCCTFFQINLFNITNYTYEKSNTTDVYIIEIE